MYHVLVHDSRDEDHFEHLKMIFLQIKETGLKLKLSKCAFFKWHHECLRHLVVGDGIYSLKEKVASPVNVAPSTYVMERGI